MGNKITEGKRGERLGGVETREAEKTDEDAVWYGACLPMTRKWCV